MELRPSAASNTSAELTMPKTVQEIMSRCVITIGEEDTMDTIREQMETHGVRHVPVVDGKKLVGLVSQRDLLRFSNSEFRPSRVSQAIDVQRARDTFAAQVMTRKLVSVRPETPLAEAAALVVEHKFGCLPVTAPDGTLLGIVTSHDFVRALIDLMGAAD
jgi:CBS domain-containing protein